MDKCKIFADNVDEIIGKSKKSLTEIANMVGVSRTTLQSLKTRKNMSLYTAFKLSDGLSIPIDILACDAELPAKLERLNSILNDFDWYISRPMEERKRFIKLAKEYLGVFE